MILKSFALLLGCTVLKQSIQFLGDGGHVNEWRWEWGWSCFSLFQCICHEQNVPVHCTYSYSFMSKWTMWCQDACVMMYLIIIMDFYISHLLQAKPCWGGAVCNKKCQVKWWYCKLCSALGISVSYHIFLTLLNMVDSHYSHWCLPVCCDPIITLKYYSLWSTFKESSYNIIAIQGMGILIS